MFFASHASSVSVFTVTPSGLVILTVPSGSSHAPGTQSAANRQNICLVATRRPPGGAEPTSTVKVTRHGHEHDVGHAQPFTRFQSAGSNSTPSASTPTISPHSHGTCTRWRGPQHPHGLQDDAHRQGRHISTEWVQTCQHGPARPWTRYTAASHSNSAVVGSRSSGGVQHPGTSARSGQSSHSMQLTPPPRVSAWSWGPNRRWPSRARREPRASQLPARGCPRSHRARQRSSPSAPCARGSTVHRTPRRRPG